MQRRSNPRRRDFLANVAATAGLAAGLAAVGEARSAETPTADSAGRQLLELRTYEFASPQKQKAYADFLAESAIPAFNRAGIEPVGAFRPRAAPGAPADAPAPADLLYVLLPHKSLASLLGLAARLEADEAYQKAGQSILRCPKSDPAYVRFDSMLLHAFEAFPGVKPPPKSDALVYELRTYESRDDERAYNKLAMFNTGELPIFARAQMTGVFFGGAIAAPDMPQLTYMIAHESEAVVKKNWAAFMGDPGWAKLKAEEQYKDNVSKIIDRFVTALPGSQV